MLETLPQNFDSIDFNHPRFRSRACTRCLRCKGVDLTVERRGDANFWHCNECRKFAAVGLGAQHQLTRKIRWRKRFANAAEVGTPLDFLRVLPEPAAYAVVDYGGFRDEDWLFLKSLKLGIDLEEEVADCGQYREFTNLASALVYIAKEQKRWPYQFNMRVDGNPLTYHEIMEAFAPPR